jgi:hypothetical protein
MFERQASLPARFECQKKHHAGPLISPLDRSEIGSRGRLRRRAVIDPRVMVFNAKFARPGENLGAAILKHRA